LKGVSMIKIFIDELLHKAGMDNKYRLTCLAIQRTKQLIKEKNKLELLGSKEKIPSIVLREIMEGKLKPEDFEKKNENK